MPFKKGEILYNIWSLTTKFSPIGLENIMPNGENAG